MIQNAEGLNLFGGDKRDRTAELLRDAAKAAFGGGKLNKNIQEGQRFGEQNKKRQEQVLSFSSGGDKRDRTAEGVGHGVTGLSGDR